MHGREQLGGVHVNWPHCINLHVGDSFPERFEYRARANVAREHRERLETLSAKEHRVPTTVAMHQQILASAAFREHRYDTRTIPGFAGAKGNL